MLWKDDNDPSREIWTPWVIGAFAIVLFAVATYVNYGNSFHWGSATDISATTAPRGPDQ